MNRDPSKTLKNVLLGAGSLLALATALSGTPANAVTGFTGAFAFQNTSGNPTYWTPNTQCSLTLPTYPCVEVANPDAYFASDNAATSTTWTWQNSSGSRYYVSFQWQFPPPSDDPDPLPPSDGDYVVLTANGATIADTQVGGSGYGSFTNLEIDPGQTFTITIHSTTNAELYIGNFNYAVPAPLPAAGAATAFGYSRRLRRRIKGKLPSKLKQSSTPSYPGAYLNLPPVALQAIPLTFNYQARSEGRFSMVASASSSSRFASH